MKLMKRFLAVMLSAALLSPMTAYAAQADDARALYEQVVEKQKSITDMNAFYDFKMNVSGSALQSSGMDSMDMRMEMNVKMNHINNPQQLRYMAYTRATLAEDSQLIMSMYYLDGYYYMDMMGQKIKYAMPMGDMMEQATAMSSAFEAPENLMSDFNMWDEGENKVIGFTIDEGQMNSYLQSVMGTAGLNTMAADMTMKLSNMHCEYVVNPAGDCIKMRLKMDMSMNYSGETINISLDGDVGIADPGQPVDVPAPNPAEYTLVDMSTMTE